jgi:hypothetical protein
MLEVPTISRDENLIKRTLPEKQPIAIVLPRIIELEGRYSGGIQRIRLPFKVIQERSQLTQYADQLGSGMEWKEGRLSIIEPISVTR